MKVHFIAIGGSAMHNLAIALHKKGVEVSGSDDEIFNPSKNRLLQYGLLPEKFGWFPGKLHAGLDAVIVGMHARADNPELARAKELKLSVYSYPEYLYEHAKDKTRVVIGGSHGKTTITAMVLHVLNHHQIAADYMVGAQLEGFEVMVSLSDKAPFMIIEGDEYLSSPIDPRPKFHIYKPHIALISGIAWDHINVFPSFDMYVDQFRGFIHCIEENGKLVYCTDDSLVKALCEQEATDDICLYPYGLPEYQVDQEQVCIIHKKKKRQVQLFGKHNLMNINGARLICMQLGITDDMFFEAIRSFKGASRRLEKVHQNGDVLVFRDFAHAPSKIAASTRAVKDFFPDKKVIACMELHTFSSLSQHFLEQYKGSLDTADEAIVFFDPHAIQLKRLPDLEPQSIVSAFEKDGLRVCTNIRQMEEILLATLSSKAVYLFMSSGNLGGFRFNAFYDMIDKKL